MKMLWWVAHGTAVLKVAPEQLRAASWHETHAEDLENLKQTKHRPRRYQS